MTTHTHKVIENTYTSLLKHKEIEEQISIIGKWIHDVEGENQEDALGFISKYLYHLNDNTKKSMYEHILNITQTQLIDINKKNDLMLLINELVKLL